MFFAQVQKVETLAHFLNVLRPLSIFRYIICTYVNVFIQHIAFCYYYLWTGVTLPYNIEHFLLCCNITTMKPNIASLRIVQNAKNVNDQLCLT